MTWWNDSRESWGTVEGRGLAKQVANGDTKGDCLGKPELKGADHTDQTYW